MKIALSLVTLIIVTAQMAFAKDRYLVTFKSEQGYQAMQNYFMTESSQNKVGLQKSLQHVRALVLKSKNLTLIESLKNHPEIQSVEAEKFFPAPKPINGFKIARVLHTEMNPSHARFNYTTSTAVPVFKAGDATPWGIVAVNAGAAWAQSAAGANTRVLVLDTGVDINHPAIAENFEKGQNFTEAADGTMDSTKFADDEGHGTHCAGTVLGAYNETTGFTGVAPKAKLLMGRVCGVDGCSNISVIDGINWGIEQHVDVISMSLGGPLGNPAELNAVQNAEKAGIVVVAASGNSATEPTYSYDRNDPKCKSGNPFEPIECGVGYPAAFPTVVAVGALDSSLVKTNFSQWGPELDVTAPGAAVISSVPMGTGRNSDVTLVINGIQQKVKSAAFSGTKLFSTPVVKSLVVVPGMGTEADFAKVDVSGKFALVSRGEIKFVEKVQNAVAAKAVGVIIYNNTAGLMQGALSEDGSLIDMPVVMVEQTQGAALIDVLNRGGAITAGILLTPSDYASFDGTSMAAPHVAGVVALIRSANKNLTPAQVRQILKSSSRPLSPNNTNQYGAGLVQADQAVTAAINTH